MRYFLGFSVLLLVLSCTKNEVQDPITGLHSVYRYDGVTYNSSGVFYNLYNKVNSQYYYYFLIGAKTAQQFSLNDTIAKAQVDGDFIRVLFVGDSLDKIFGQHQIQSSDLNVLRINNKMDTITDGQLIFSLTEAKHTELQIIATTKGNKRLDARAEFETGSIAYRVYRTVKGSFSLKDSIYDLSRAWNKYDSTLSQMTIVFEDNNDTIASQILFTVSDSDRTVNSTYSTGSGYVRLNDIPKSTRYYDFIQGAKLEFVPMGAKYNAQIKLRTTKGDSVKGTYYGVIEKYF